MRSQLAALLAGTISMSALAQDLTTVTRFLGVAGLDSDTGTLYPIAPGFANPKGLARDGVGQLWSTGFFNGAAQLIRIDPGNGTWTVTATLPHSPHSLATASGTGLYAAAASMLLHIDTATGVMTAIGDTGLADLGAIVTLGNQLYGWDRLLGLVVLDPLTGAATDVNPMIGGGTLATSGIDWMAVRNDGVMVGGTSPLRFTFDMASGIAQFVGGVLQDEVLGAATGVVRSYGTGCAGGAGPVQLTVSGPLLSASNLTSTSTGHGGAGGTPYPGVLIFGFGNASHAGNALPLDLGPLLGTQGCSLLASIDASVLGLTNNGSLQFPLALPPGLGGLTFYLQHAVFEPVVGSMSWSGGVRVQLGR